MPLGGDDHPKLVARINRIEGQVRGLKKMIGE
jgi:DNA-binding FrmR family transcriptional regulator